MRELGTSVHSLFPLVSSNRKKSQYQLIQEVIRGQKLATLSGNGCSFCPSISILVQFTDRLTQDSRFLQHRFTSVESQIQHVQLCSCCWTMCGILRPRPFVQVFLGVCHGDVPKRQPPTLPSRLSQRSAALCTGCYLVCSFIPMVDYCSLAEQLGRNIMQCTEQSPGSTSSIQNCCV